MEGFQLSWWPLSGLDQGAGRALQVAFKARSREAPPGEETPLYVPDVFLIFDGSLLDFYGDLAPVRLRKVGLEGFGTHPLAPGPLTSRASC